MIRATRPDPLEVHRITVRRAVGAVFVFCDSRKMRSRSGAPQGMGASIETRNVNADDSTADPETPGSERAEVQVAAPGILPAEARGLHPRLHHHPEEAELGHAEGRQGAA